SNINLLSNKIQKNLENLRLLPFSTISSAFTRLVRDLAKQQQKQIELVIEGKEVNVDKRILEEIKDPLLHIMRNAVDHGIETSAERQKQGKNPTATIRLQAYQTGNTINIEVQDDGRGLNLEKIKQTALQRGIHTPAQLAAMSTEQIQALIFASGFSTRSEVSEISGRGVGLDVVKTNVEKLQGNLTVESKAGQGCKFHLQLSTSITTSKVLIVRVNSHPYAIPIEYVDRILLLAKSEIFSLQGNQTIKIAGLPVSVVWLADLLQLPLNVPSTISNAKANAKVLPCLVIKIGKQKLGLLVEEITTQTDIVVKPQNKLLEGISHSNGASILSNGEVCLVLNAQDLITTEQNTGSNNHSVATDKQLSSLLLVEDSIVIRTQMKRILESAGYQVTTAVDGLEGWQKLQAGTFDGVVSDVEMPNLDGLSLTAKIRQYPKYQELPVILITTLAKEADKRRGIEAGANAYLTKGDFDQSLLLETLNRLI
ncbi:MAG: hybrid sensor histidine kinase/response regulator, partial [Cyanobacteria bacterium J083]